MRRVAGFRLKGWLTSQLRELRLTEVIPTVFFLGFLAIMVFLLSGVTILGVLDRLRPETHGIPLTYSFAAAVKILYLLTISGIFAVFWFFWQDRARQIERQK